MAYDNNDRLIALAGLYQAVGCVTRIAHGGSLETELMEPCLHSLFQIDAESVEAVFGNPGAVSAGARQIISQLTAQPKRSLELTQYVAQVIKLERSLSGRPDMLAAIGQGIEQAKTKRDHLGLTHASVFAHFGELYSGTLSKLSPRIIVRGNPDHLRSPENQARVRTLLLAAVRAAMLWRQVGGSRMQILLKGRQMLEDAKRYLDAHET